MYPSQRVYWLQTAPFESYKLIDTVVLYLCNKWNRPDHLKGPIWTLHLYMAWKWLTSAFICWEALFFKDKWGGFSGIFAFHILCPKIKIVRIILIQGFKLKILHFILVLIANLAKFFLKYIYLIKNSMNLWICSPQNKARVYYLYITKVEDLCLLCSFLLNICVFNVYISLNFFFLIFVRFLNKKINSSLQATVVPNASLSN